MTRLSNERMCAGREFQLLGEDTQKAIMRYVLLISVLFNWSAGVSLIKVFCRTVIHFINVGDLSSFYIPYNYVQLLLRKPCNVRQSTEKITYF